MTHFRAQRHKKKVKVRRSNAKRHPHCGNHIIKSSNNNYSSSSIANLLQQATQLLVSLLQPTDRKVDYPHYLDASTPRYLHQHSPCFFTPNETCTQMITASQIPHVSVYRFTQAALRLHRRMPLASTQSTLPRYMTWKAFGVCDGVSHHRPSVRFRLPTHGFVMTLNQSGNTHATDKAVNSPLSSLTEIVPG